MYLIINAGGNKNITTTTIVQVKSMCVPILRSIGSELTKLENMQQLYVLFDVTWRKNGTDSTLLIGILTRNILKPTISLYDFRFKSYGSNRGFRVFGDLDLDLCSIFIVTRIAHGVLEYPCEVSLQSIQYEWVICCMRLKFWKKTYAL